MLLYTMFLEIAAGKLSSGYQDVFLKKSDIDVAVRREVACYRTLSNPSNTSKVAAYRYLLNYCKQVMHDSSERPLLPILLEVLGRDDFPLENTICCEVLAQLFDLNTKGQEDASSLAILGKFLIDTPKCFTAFLIYLCRRGVSAEVILSTYLLHDFFSYHLNVLGAVDNDIHRLYRQLSHFPEAASLVLEAQNISTNERAFESYALDGVIRGGLKKVEKEPPLLKFSPVVANLNGLYQLFDYYFLLGALEQWSAQEHHTVWYDFMVVLFNRQDVIESKLPMLLSASYERPYFQQILAEILDDSVINHFVLNKNADILCLINFRPQLVGMIQNLNLKDYLEGIITRASSTLVLITGLLMLMDSLKATKDKSIKLVFEKLLEAILQESYVLEDQAIVNKIRKFSCVDECIVQKANLLEAEFNTVLLSQVANGVENLDYITVEDVWRKNLSQMNSLQEIIAFNSNYPTDKYELYIRLAKAFLHQDSLHFDFIVFINALNISFAFSKDITSYERVLVELLGAIDDQAWRTLCVSLLDQYVLERSWRTYHYNDQDFYQRAVHAGNLGLIQWLEKEGIKPCLSYDALAIEAARLNHWLIVSHIHKNHPLKTVTLNILLTKAVMQNANGMISLLWSSGCQMPSAVQIKNSLMMAVANNNPEMVQAIFDYFKRPYEHIIVNALNQAIKLEHFGVAVTIAKQKKSKNLANSIDDAIITASKKNQSSVLLYLIPFSRLCVIETAFLNAVRANHFPSIQYLFENKIFKIRESVILRALNESKKAKHPGITFYLENKMTPKITMLRSVSYEEFTSRGGLKTFGLFSPRDNRERERHQIANVF